MSQNKHYALAREAILAALTAYTGVTTADGATPANNTLIDSNLIGENDFISGKSILIGAGVDASYEDKLAATFDSLTGGITVSSGYSAQIKLYTPFRVLNVSTGGVVSVLLNAILAAVGPTGPAQGLYYYGVVTEIPAPNEFTIPTLAGLGAAKFTDMSGIAPYYAFVFRDAAGGGAAPQGEYQPITNYGTGSGTFSSDAFTVPLGIGDEILIIHPFLAKIMNFAGLPPHVGTTPGNWQTAEADIVSIGAVLTNYKLHSLVLDINNLVGTVTIRMYQDVVGTERRCYQQAFTVAVDGPGLWIVNGTVGIHEILRVTAQSDAVADNTKAIGYDYMIEAM